MLACVEFSRMLNPLSSIYNNEPLDWLIQMCSVYFEVKVYFGLEH